MPNIYDNIDSLLVEGLRRVLPEATACSFCVGYLNLRGWGQIADLIDRLPGGSETRACRLLVGMQRPPEVEANLRSSLRRQIRPPNGPTLARLRHRISESFKDQLEFGVPSNQAEHALRELARQLRARKAPCKNYFRFWVGKMV